MATKSPEHYIFRIVLVICFLFMAIAFVAFAGLHTWKFIHELAKESPTKNTPGITMSDNRNGLEGFKPTKRKSRRRKVRGLI
jgi:hypothetical protein